MNQWSLRRPCWLRVMVRLPLILIAAAVCVFCAYMAYCYIVLNVFQDKLEWYYILLGILTLLFSILFAAVCFGLILDGFTQVSLTRQGIETRRFFWSGKRIDWGDLSETGIGLENWSVKNGPFRCLYFSDRPLEDIERAVIDNAHTDRKKGGLVWVRCDGIQNTEALKQLCPLPIPEVKQTADISRYCLYTYRREKKKDGSWSDAKLNCLPDARKVVGCCRSLQRRKHY